MTTWTNWNPVVDPPRGVWNETQNCPLEGRGSRGFIHKLQPLRDRGSLLGLSTSSLLGQRMLSGRETQETSNRDNNPWAGGVRGTSKVGQGQTGRPLPAPAIAD